MSRTLLAAAALVALSGFAGPTFAADQETASVAVPAGKVDFHDEAQVKQLYASLRHAANAVCGVYSSDPGVSRSQWACAEQALADAVQRANRPMLTAMDQRAHPDNRALATGY